MINWISYPKSTAPHPLCAKIASVFEQLEEDITSEVHTLNSNSVLSQVARELESLGSEVERGKRMDQKISVPVLFKQNGIVDKSFEVDAWHRQERFVVEVEAGRAVANHQFLKDLFEACMMRDVEYLCVAVRNKYKAGKVESSDFRRVVGFFETLYASRRLQLPLEGVMVLGY